VIGKCPNILAISQGKSSALSPHPMSSGIRKVLYIGAGFIWPHTYIDELLVSALSSLGVEVVFLPIIPEPFHAETLALFKNFESKFREFTLSRSISTDLLITEIKKEAPDLIFTIQGYMIPRDILYEISNCGVPSAVWLMDEPYDTSRSVEIGSFFHHVFIQDAATLEFHRRHGNTATHYLPHGFDNLEPPAKSIHDVFNPDISMIGTGFPLRQQAILALAGVGEIFIAGNKWDGFTNCNGITLLDPVSLREATTIYRQSRINLTIHREANDYSTWESPLAPRSPNGSLFYIAGAGGFQIADDTRSETCEFFDTGKEIVLFHELGELNELVRYYLCHDGERKRICEAARQRALAEHTYAHRMRKLLDSVTGKASSASPRFFGKTVIRCPGNGTQIDLPQDDHHVIDLVPQGLLVDREPCPEKNGREIAKLLNTAFLHVSSLHTVITPVNSPRIREMLREAIELLTGDPTLGAVSLRNGTGELTGAALSNRILWKTGSFQDGYCTLGQTIDDLLLRMEVNGNAVISLRNDGTSLSATLPPGFNGRCDPEKFDKTWGKKPQKRVEAKKLILMSNGIKQGGDLDGALSLARQALALDASFADALRHVGSLLLYRGEEEKAAPYLRSAWEADPENVSSGLLLSLLLRSRREYSEALQILEDFEEKDISDIEKTSVLMNLGICSRELGRAGDALLRFGDAIAIAPFFVPALKEIVSIRANQGEFNEALECLEKIIQVEPDNYEALNDKGVLLYNLGRKTEAIEYINRALKINRDYIPALDNLKSLTIEP
jgi:spore maturation protein CgeB